MKREIDSAKTDMHGVTVTGRVQFEARDETVQDFLYELAGLARTLYSAEYGVLDLEGRNASNWHLAGILMQRVEALYVAAGGKL